MLSKRIALIFTAALAICALASPAAHAAKPRPWVFMLAGQSNMQGAAAVPTNDRLDGRILRQGHVGARWTIARDPLNGLGMGPGMTFAREIIKRHPDQRIVLVPCALGGTNMLQWKPGGDLYNDCVRRTRDAVSRGGVAKGILFAQGESDGTIMALANRWAFRYTRMIGSFRKGLGRNLPVVHTVIHADAKYRASSKVVQRQQRRHLTRNDTGVETRDLNLIDAYHYTANGYRTLGRRMARAWMAQR